MNKSNFFDLDSYKISHHKQLPENTIRAMSYIESRGGADELKFFGLQYILKQMQAPTKEEVELAYDKCQLHLGDPKIFNYEGWMEIAEMGYYPLKVRAVREGEVYPTGVPLVTVENTIPGFEWLVSWFETQFLRVWYPTTVATTSWRIRNVIMDYLDWTGTPEAIDFKLHDFGARGVSSRESAAIGGMAHLMNFKGTDTLAGWDCAYEFYNASPFSIGHSIPASEHSTITSWSRDYEIEAYANMIRQFGGEGSIYACVSDSYDIWAALEMWKKLEPMIVEYGGTLVVRPDSGDPVDTPVAVVERLIELFGYTLNDKGFKVLPDYIRVIQGDGVNEESIAMILTFLRSKGISADNIAFGMGGALLQQHSRDDLKFAMKMCAITIQIDDGSVEDIDVYKDPVTDKGKRSKRGYLTTVHDFEGGYEHTHEGENDASLAGDAMQTVWMDGDLLVDYNFEDIRE